MERRVSYLFISYFETTLDPQVAPTSNILRRIRIAGSGLLRSTEQKGRVPFPGRKSLVMQTDEREDKDKRGTTIRSIPFKGTMTNGRSGDESGDRSSWGYAIFSPDALVAMIESILFSNSRPSHVSRCQFRHFKRAPPSSSLLNLFWRATKRR